jgi:hypothetical protein
MLPQQAHFFSFLSKDDIISFLKNRCTWKSFPHIWQVDSDTSHLEKHPAQVFSLELLGAFFTSPPLLCLRAGFSPGRLAAILSTRQGGVHVRSHCEMIVHRGRERAYKRLR